MNIVQGTTLLHVTSSQGWARALAWLLDNGLDTQLNQGNLASSRPIHCAALAVRLEALKVLLAAGADLTLLNGANESAFQLASEKCARLSWERVEVCKLLASQVKDTKLLRVFTSNRWEPSVETADVVNGLFALTPLAKKLGQAQKQLQNFLEPPQYELPPDVASHSMEARMLLKRQEKVDGETLISARDAIRKLLKQFPEDEEAKDLEAELTVAVQGLAADLEAKQTKADEMMALLLAEEETVGSTPAKKKNKKKKKKKKKNSD